MQFFTYLSLFIIVTGPSVERHAVYISVVEIEAKEIRVKVFSDDLRDAIRNHSGVTSDSSITNYCDRYQSEIQQYFAQKLTLIINQNKTPFQYQKSSEEGDSYWITFGFTVEEDWKSIKVEDRHFMELFPTQSNIIKVNWPELRFGRLNMAQPSCSFEF